MFKKLRNKYKTKNGFTMVELIVVIVIILVLAGALVPSLMKYVDNAKKANCKADAAVILSQLQADYTASKAKEQTGVPMITVFEGINIKKENKVSVTSEKRNAVYQEKDGEITLFSYYDGEKYTATWTSNTGWLMTTNGTPNFPANTP